MVKYLKLADVKDVLSLYDREKITLSRLTEILNERIEKRLKTVHQNYSVEDKSISQLSSK